MSPIRHATLLVVAALSLYLAGAAEPSPETDRLPGVDLAEGLSQLTGVAISPLIGTSAIGAYRYFRTPAAGRPALPWFCHPATWGLGLSVVSLCFLKDLVGPAAPTLVKKPLDFAELFEDKLSALIACSAFVPFVAAQVTRHLPDPASATASVDTEFVVSAGLPLDPRIIAVPISMVLFALAWMTGHAVNVLVAFCPFGIVDSLLKLGKAAVLGILTITAMINPFLGAAVALAVLVLAIMLAPWAFRLTVFGTLFGLDVLFAKRAGERARPTRPHAFLARAIDRIPVRTYGRLARDQEGSVTFTYRPWLVGLRRRVPLPAGDVTVVRGVIFPSLYHSPNAVGRRRVAVVFLPRYRKHEETIGTHFALAVEDGPVVKSFRAMRQWLRDTASFGKEKFRLLAPGSET